jgi:hypothetical protein
MAGKTKWGHLKGQLPEWESPNKEHNDKVRSAVEALRGTAVSDLTLQINQKEDEKDALEARLKYVKFSIEVAEGALAVAMKLAGFESVVSNGYTWTPTGEPYPSIEDKQAFLAWAHEHAAEALTLHDKKMKSIVKEALDTNEPIPPGIKVFFKSTFSRTVKES